MQHIVIISGFLAFGVGIVAMMTVHRYLIQFKVHFLKLYQRFLLVLNISVLLNLTTHYLLTNMWQSMANHSKVLIIIVINIAGFYLLIILTHFYIMLTASLVGKGLEKRVKQILIMVIIIASLAYGFSTALWASSSKIGPFLLIHKIFISIPLLMSLTASLVLYSRARSKTFRSEGQVLKIFSLVYCFFYIYQLSLWFFPIEVWVTLSAFNLLVHNIIPTPFLKHFFKVRAAGIMKETDKRERIEAFYNKFGLSKREVEIADLIVNGKTNEEIENELFISIFTVKKHISNIFMKMDINSRAQLISMILKEALFNPNAQ